MTRTFLSPLLMCWHVSLIYGRYRFSIQLLPTQAKVMMCVGIYDKAEKKKKIKRNISNGAGKLKNFNYLKACESVDKTVRDIVLAEERRWVGIGQWGLGKLLKKIVIINFTLRKKKPKQQTSLQVYETFFTDII